MRKLLKLWYRAFDIREGEYLRTLLMGLYFLFTLFAANILKPVSWALFLNKFEIDRLPYLYMLIAVVGGILAYLYTKILVKTSLQVAVTVATILCVASLLVFWVLIDAASTWLLYIFSVFVSLLGIVFVSQGWLIAANIFNSREAKRLYGLLGLGAILGAAFGGSFTAFTAELLGSTNLMPASAIFVILAYVSLYFTCQVHKRKCVISATAIRQEEEEADQFTFHDLVSAIARYRHLLVIIGIISVTFMVEVLVEFQFSALAKATYTGDQLTIFLGKFYGVYLSTATFILQFFFTTLVVGRLGVGRTLLVSPLSVGIAAAGVVAAPGLIAAAATRLVESATRYSINRTAIELLYLPLPSKLKNRTKTFVDIFVDRLGRGSAALMLVFLTSLGLASPRHLSALIMGFVVLWILLAGLARNEYVRTVRRRVESRRLDLEGARITVQDTETVRLLEQVARGTNARQVVYALSLLEEAPNYDPKTLLGEIVDSPSVLIRTKGLSMGEACGNP